MPAQRQRRLLVVYLLTLRKILAQSDGRDKLVKVVQYFGKVLIWTHLHKPAFADSASASRVKAIVSNFSTWRKIGRLGHALEPWAELNALDLSFNSLTVFDARLKALSIINNSISLANDCVDDVICLAKIGAIDKSYAKKLEWTSSIMWYSTIFLDLHDNVQALLATTSKIRDFSATKMNDDEFETRDLERGTQALLQKRFMTTVNIAKLSLDFVFCTVDVFEPKRISDGWQAIPGFLSGLLGTYKWIVKASSS